MSVLLALVVDLHVATFNMSLMLFSGSCPNQIDGWSAVKAVQYGRVTYEEKFESM